MKFNFIGGQIFLNSRQICWFFGKHVPTMIIFYFFFNFLEKSRSRQTFLLKFSQRLKYPKTKTIKQNLIKNLNNISSALFNSFLPFRNGITIFILSLLDLFIALGKRVVRILTQTFIELSYHIGFLKIHLFRWVKHLDWSSSSSCHFFYVLDKSHDLSSWGITRELFLVS